MTNTEVTNRAASVGVIVLNWKRPVEILDCLASITAQDYPVFEVVVVDNGSNNGSVAEIRRRFPSVEVVENGRNIGFAAGSNVGIETVLGRGADYVLLLNDDTRSAPDLLARLTEVGESDSSIGVLGPTIYYDQPSNVIWSAGGMIDKLGDPAHLSIGETDHAWADTSRDVDYVTGCALLIKRGVVDRVGRLDPRFFAYWEEAEFCGRARALGFRVVHVPQARVWHRLLPGERELSPDYLYLMTRNRLLYLRCMGAGPLPILIAVVRTLKTVASWSLRTKHRERRPYTGALLRGVWDFLRGRFGAPVRRTHGVFS